jgi:Transcriptional accessory protein
MEMEFESLSPEEAALSNAKIIITTKDEAAIVRRKDVLLDTELDDYPVFTKAKILRNIMGPYHDDQLTIGIDPGVRIGISVIFLHNEIESIVESSPEAAIKLVSHLLSRIISNKKIVRIGNGNIAMARQIAFILKTKFKEQIEIEIVDERGTSLPQNTEANRRGVRDIASARTIAFRRGKLFKPPDSSYMVKN